ncbi:hypothetical protein [Halapricum desulfuricans]|uniref:hypothetical protein n=1 Tax=Halapricum desulfuricans TaxID=2841257 RepID=UPI001E5CB035|nr:hypothetical protein [Halapricum desulfuricans]
MSGLAVFGVETHLAYVATISGGRSEQLPPSQWPTGQYEPLFAFGEFDMVVRGITIVGVVALAVLARWSDAEHTDRLVFVLGLVTMVIVTPSPNIHVLNVLIPV